MSDWTSWDTLGILIVLGVVFGIAGYLEGLAQAAVALLGVVIALLWIGTFLLEGYTEAVTPERSD